MTIRKNMLAALVLTLPAAGASAQQEPWTLDRCIEYAVENNISIQQFRLRAEDQDVKLNTARNSRLPNLNAGLGGMLLRVAIRLKIGMLTVSPTSSLPWLRNWFPKPAFSTLFSLPNI